MTAVDALPSAHLVRDPTPVHRLDRGDGPPLLVKRDDLCVPAFGGCKARALDLALGAALAAGADTVLTCGTAGSNHVAAAAVLGRAVGLATRALVLPQADSPLVRRNVALGRRAGAEVIPVPAGTSLRSEAAAMRGQARALRAAGRRLFVLPFGGSGGLGGLAHALAAAELADQVCALGSAPPAAVYLAAATMTTAAGVLVGLRLGGLASTLVAVQVAGEPAAAPRLLLERARAVAAALPTRTRAVTGADVDVRAEPAPGGRAAPPDRLGCPALPSRMELDEVYTAPAFAAFLRDAAVARRGRAPLLFWHTGSTRAVRTREDGCSDVDAMDELDAL